MKSIKRDINITRGVVTVEIDSTEEDVVHNSNVCSMLCMMLGCK